VTDTHDPYLITLLKHLVEQQIPIRQQADDLHAGLVARPMPGCPDNSDTIDSTRAMNAFAPAGLSSAM
jgi:hypothetical protein